MRKLLQLVVLGWGLLLANSGNAAKSALHVRIGVTQSLSAPQQPPDLQVQVRNDGPSAIPFMHFESDICFAHFYLQLTLRRPNLGQEKAQLSCAIRSWPGQDRTLAPGETISRRLPLRQLFQGPFLHGHYVIDAAWNPQELATFFAGKYAWEAREREQGNSEFDLQTPLATVTIQKGQMVSLPDGTQLTFAAHGHKRTHPGQTSPLSIHGSFRVSGSTPNEFSVNLFPSEDRVFVLQDRYRFVLLDHQYDQSMRLDYFGAKAVRPASDRDRDR